MSKIINNIFYIIIFTVILSSCSEYQKTLKSTDYKRKYDKAMEYYEKGEYTRALTLLEGISAIYKGTDKEDEVIYYQAYCNYNLGDYILAGFYFKEFAKIFPTSPLIEDVEFKGAYCYYKDSPRYNLDQSNTKDAIAALQLFTAKFPGSPKVADCNKLIDELRGKLEKKSFRISKLYFDVGDYQAASISLKNTLKDFPDTEYREEAMFLIVKANYLYAINSVIDKQEERLQLAIKAFYPFEDEFPQSKMLKEAKKIFKDSEEKLAKIQSEPQISEQKKKES